MTPEIPDNLTRREKDILHILWDSEESMTAAQVVSAKEGLTMNTVQAVLRKLLKTGLIEVDKIVYSGTVLSRSYRPTLTEADFEISLFSSKYKKMKKRMPISSVMVSLLGSVGDQEITRKEIDELEAILKQLEDGHPQ